MKILANCVRSLRREFKFENIGFEHNDDPNVFFKSQWQLADRSIVYLIYRWIWALFFTGVFVASLVLQFSGGKLFIFLTNWGLIMCVLTNLLAAYLVTLRHFPQLQITTPEYGRSTPGEVKVYWLLHSIALPLALVISTMYWLFLHGNMNKPVRFPVMSFITHCLNSAFMLVDFAVVGFPVRLLHIVHSMLLTCFYCLFTVMYFFCGGTDDYGRPYVYPILDWTKPARGMITFAVVFGLYLLFGLVLFTLYKLKCVLLRSQRVFSTPEIAGVV